MEDLVPKKRGRPPGSKNRPKTPDVTAVVPIASLEVIKADGAEAKVSGELVTRAPRAVAKKDKYPDNPVRHLAEMVFTLTGGGESLVRFLLDVQEGRVEDATVRDRIEAAKFLSERGFGKAPQSVEVSGKVVHQIEGQYDLGKLSDEELRELDDKLSRARVEDAVVVDE